MTNGESVKDMTSKFDKLAKFEGQDFRRWQKKMHFLLTTLKVVYVLSTPSPEWDVNEALETTRKRMKWENDDYICRGHILNGMPWSHLWKCTSGVIIPKMFLDVFIHPQVYMNIEAGIQKLPIRHIAALPGAFDPWRHAVDFYISDFQSGLRALVKAGYGARVTPYVEESVVIDIDQSNKNMSSQFKNWLAERKLSTDDRVLRLKEGYIKEGSSVSVLGVVQRNDNVLMIVPPPEPVPTGCLWTRCMLPASLEGIVLRCNDSSNHDIIPV